MSDLSPLYICDLFIIVIYSVIYSPFNALIVGLCYTVTTFFLVITAAGGYGSITNNMFTNGSSSSQVS